MNSADEADANCEPGFYKVLVQELGPPFWTIGLWFDYGGGMTKHWKFADGDGDEMGSGFTVLKVEEKIIMKDREYE